MKIWRYKNENKMVGVRLPFYLCLGAMTNHMHVIVGSNSDNKVSDILRDFKKFTSKEIIRTLLVES